MKRLIEIQNTLIVKKTQYNKFGDFYYRSLDDITEALKPILKRLKCAVIFKDEIILIGARYYVNSTIVLFDETGKIIAKATGSARENENEPKMKQPQVTGGSISFARKYACNALFLLDDSADPDNTAGRPTGAKTPPKQQQQQAPQQQQRPPQQQQAQNMAQHTGQPSQTPQTANLAQRTQAINHAKQLFNLLLKPTAKQKTFIADIDKKKITVIKTAINSMTENLKKQNKNKG